MKILKAVLVGAVFSVSTSAMQLVFAAENKTAATTKPVVALPVIEKPDSIPTRLVALFDKGSGNYNERLKCVHSIKDPSDSEVKALMYFLLLKQDDGFGLAPLEFNAIKNDIANILVNQKPPPEGLASLLVSMFSKADNDELWRDYCIQFLGALYPSIPEENEKRLVQETFKAALKDKSAGIPGTTLIAMRRQVGTRGFKAVDVATDAFALLESKECGTASKTTALQICAELKCAKALPIARKLAADTNADTNLRTSAFAAIGMLGDKSDLPLLKEYSNNPDNRLKTSSTNALKRLSN